MKSKDCVDLISGGMFLVWCPSHMFSCNKKIDLKDSLLLRADFLQDLIIVNIAEEEVKTPECSRKET